MDYVIDDLNSVVSYAVHCNVLCRSFSKKRQRLDQGKKINKLSKTEFVNKTNHSGV